MIHKFLYMAALVVSTGLSYAQIDVVRTISLEKDPGKDKLYLMHEDSSYRILAPESAINTILMRFKENDRLPLAFRQLNADNSTDYAKMSVKRGLASESQFLIHELMEHGNCLIEQKKDGARVKLIIAMSYTSGQVKGIKYSIGDHILYNYIDPSNK